jgi:alpha-D-ribose 1-methylphosphonate 5-triphosphate synthase subunit PhnI
LADDKTRAELKAVLGSNLGHGGTFDYQHRAMDLEKTAPRLDLLDDAMDGIGHVEARQAGRQRRIIAERQALIRREHDKDDMAAGNQYSTDGRYAPVGSL